MTLGKIKGGFKGVNGHLVQNPHGVPLVYWRKNIYGLRMGHAKILRRTRNG